jgi:two-component system, OmpR family, phosphate regulon sensor histidine kinase PhoR
MIPKTRLHRSTSVLAFNAVGSSFQNLATHLVARFSDRIKDLKQLERLNASHETFIYAVSHDLNAPLTNIESLVHILIEESSVLNQKGGAGNKEQEMIAAMLDQSVTIMRNIINELTELAKNEGDYQEMVETLNFEQIIKEVEIIINDEIKESKAKIILDIKELEVVFSRKNLRSIIYNLLSNAIKYRSPDRTPEIFIKTARVNGYVQLSVKDNGLGILEEDKDKIFARFSRFRKNVKGVGIGLYLVEKIMGNAGGKINVDSTLGVGSEFKILFKPPIS